MSAGHTGNLGCHSEVVEPLTAAKIVTVECVRPIPDAAMTSRSPDGRMVQLLRCTGEGERCWLIRAFNSNGVKSTFLLSAEAMASLVRMYLKLTSEERTHISDTAGGEA